MKFFAKYIREKRQLQPEYRSDYDEVAKIRDNVVYEWALTKKRNYEFHKKYFGLLNLAHQNLSPPHDDLYKSFEHFRITMQMKAGFYETIKTDKGTIYYPSSISFSNMDDTEFQDVYNRVCDEVCKILDVTSEIIEAELLNFI